MKIYEVSNLTDAIIRAFDRLMPQLTNEATGPSGSELESILSSDNVKIIVAEDGDILGTLTLVFYSISTGKKAWIEDVVVDKSARGRGIGAGLIQYAIRIAAEAGITKIDLTSRPERIAANRLYQKLGFKIRETNLYRLEIKS